MSHCDIQEQHQNENGTADHLTPSQIQSETTIEAPPPRKTVSFPSAPERPSEKPSPISKKILARKPTPFNNDLAAQIRASGLASLIDDPKPPSPSPTDLPLPVVPNHLDESERANLDIACQEANAKAKAVEESLP